MVAPTIYFSNSATVATGTITSTTMPITITDTSTNSPFNGVTSEHKLAGTTWFQGAKVKFSGTINGVGFTSAEGVVSAQMTTSNKKIQLTITTSKAYNALASNTNYTGSQIDNITVMQYQTPTTNNGSTTYPLGIYMSSFGDQRKSFIDIYGGTATAPEGSPNVRIGLLNGLPTLDNGETPRDWGIYATNAFLKGVIVSQSGIIGGWTLDSEKLKSGTWGTSGSVLMSSGYTPTNADAKSIGGSPVTGNTWAFTAGDKFGVKTDGTLYASNGVFSGKITASTGTIGGFSIYDYYLEGRYGYLKEVATDTYEDWVSLVGLSSKNEYMFYAGSIENSVIESPTTSTSSWTDADWADYYRQIILPEVVKNGFSVTRDGVVTAAGGSVFGNKDAGHVSINNNEFDMSYGSTSVLKFSYGNAVGESGTELAPYYTIGIRNPSYSSVGAYSTTIGYNNAAQGYRSVAIGGDSNAYGSGAIAIGRTAKAQSTAVAIGTTVTASGLRSAAIGYNVTASGGSSLAMGYTNTVSGDYSTGIGRDLTVSGDYSTGIGRSSTASGANCIVIGHEAVSSASHATAIGYNTTASKAYATAIGHSTVASGTGSIAIGNNIVSTGDYNTVIGKYNKATVSGSGTATSPYTYTNVGDYAFIIGNGTANTTADRSNALTVDWSGNLVASGTISTTGITSTGAISGTNITASGSLYFKGSKAFDMEDPFVQMKIAQQTASNRPLILQFDLTSGYYDVQQVIFTNTGIEYHGRNRSTQAWERIW